MTCTHPDCGQPKGECARDCLLFQMHRVTVITANDLNTDSGFAQIEATNDGRVNVTYGKGQLPIEFADEPSAFVAAWDAYKTHRPRGRMKALIHAWKRLVRAYRTRHIPDPFKQ